MNECADCGKEGDAGTLEHCTMCFDDFCPDCFTGHGCVGDFEDDENDEQ